MRDYAVASQWKSDASSRASGLLFQFGIDVFRAAAMLTVLFSDLSIGQMLSVFSYLWFMIGPGPNNCSVCNTPITPAGGALTRINELLARADEPQYPAQVDPFVGHATVGIEVRDLHFAYKRRTGAGRPQSEHRAGQRRSPSLVPAVVVKAP